MSPGVEPGGFNEAPANSPGIARRPKRLNSGMGCAGLRALAPRDFDNRRMSVGSAFLLVKDRLWLNTLRRFERYPGFRVNRSARALAGRYEAASARR